MRPFALVVTVIATICTGTSGQDWPKKQPSDGGLSKYGVPHETIMLIQRVKSSSQFDKARSIVDVNRKAFPWDWNLPRIGMEILFLQGRYSEMSSYAQMPKEFQETFPFVYQTMYDGWLLVAMSYIAICNGVPNPQPYDHKVEDLEATVLTRAWEQRASLPLGMVDEDGVHVDKEVLTLLLLRDSFSAHRTLLFDRAAKLAPNDTFILELKAKQLILDGEEAQAVAMYKKALKAKASEVRIKHLKKELAEAEKLAEWRKVIGPKTEKKNGG